MLSEIKCVTRQDICRLSKRSSPLFPFCPGSLMQLFKKLVPVFKLSPMNFDVKLFCIYKLLFFMGQKYLFW